MEYLSKGKRGVVYVMRERGRLVVVKQKRPGSTALRALENEAYWLQQLNEHKIGPTFYRFDKKGLVMEYIKGIPFIEWRIHHSPREQKTMIRKIFAQCLILDTLQVNKLEMHYPVKHILIRRGQPIMIDFERCKRTLTPKNVTQFCQFLVALGHDVDRTALKHLLQTYKKSYGDLAFGEIVSFFC